MIILRDIFFKIIVPYAYMYICLYLQLKRIIDSAQISIYLLARSRNTMFGVRKPLVQIQVLPLANKLQFTRDLSSQDISLHVAVAKNSMA